MKIQELRASYYENSRQASTLARQLCFAGIAVVWIFNKDINAPASLPTQLVLPLICFVFALGLDLLQYLVGSALWGAFGEIREKQLKERHAYSPEANVHVPRWINWSAIVFFGLKNFATILGYILLGMRLMDMGNWANTVNP